MARSRRNPFLVSPRGATVRITEAELAARYIPRTLEREVEIEGFDPHDLPPGVTVRDGVHNGQSCFRIFFEGRDTGLYALDVRKAAEIAHRRGAKIRGERAPRGSAKTSTAGAQSVGAAPRAQVPTRAPRAVQKVVRPYMHASDAELGYLGRKGDPDAIAELTLRGRSLWEAR